MEEIKCFIENDKVHLEVYKNSVFVKRIIADTLYQAMFIKDHCGICTERYDDEV